MIKLTLFLCLFTSLAWAKNLDPRAKALEFFPERLRKAFTLNQGQLKATLRTIKVNAASEDDQAYYLNVHGVNYDLTLGKKNGLVEWMALQAPKKHAPGLYAQLLEGLSKDEQKTVVQDKTIKNGDAVERFVELDYKAQGVLYRFHADTKELFSVVVRKVP